jgi:hypothetical protein
MIMLKKAKWWIVVGILTPLLAYLYSALRGGGDRVTVVLWPSSLLLMGLPQEFGVLSVLIIAVAWALNVAIYLTIGLIVVSIAAVVGRLS